MAVTWKVNFITWGVKKPSTSYLFHIVGHVKVVATSQYGYTCPSSKAINFTINNLWFLGILRKRQYCKLFSKANSDILRISQEI